MSESIRIPIEEQSQTAEARRLARSLAERDGFDQTQVEQIAIVVTEACTNLLKHASGGEILLRSTTDDREGPPEVEVLALDRGPGLGDLEQCLRDGFSTGGSHGQGMGAMVRLSSVSDFYSTENKGTALLARWSKAATNGHRTHFIRPVGLHVGAVNVCKPGQEVCGDSWGIEQAGEICTVVVADGLGHGIEAKEASMAAIRVFKSNPGLLPVELIERIHQGLRSTRGAAVAVARIDWGGNVLTYAGVGNISAQIYLGGAAGQHLVSVNGTAGHQIQRVREFTYSWPHNGILIMHSDGLSTGTSLDSHSGLALRDPALIAGVLYRDFNRHNDDATAVVVKSA